MSIGSTKLRKAGVAAPANEAFLLDRAVGVGKMLLQLLPVAPTCATTMAEDAVHEGLRVDGQGVGCHESTRRKLRHVVGLRREGVHVHEEKSRIEEAGGSEKSGIEEAGGSEKSRIEEAGGSEKSRIEEAGGGSEMQQQK